MGAKTNTGGNFNWIAPVYDTLAFIVFGHRLQQAQVVFLNHIPPTASVLIVGGGSGWLLEQVLLTCQPRQVVYLETSSRMLSLASRRIVRKALIGSVDFRLGGETSLKPDERFDVILTPFLLDLFTERTLASSWIPQLRNALKVDGLWLVTDFVKSQIYWQKALLWIMIRFFWLAAGIEVDRLADWQKILTESGLKREKQQTQVGGMVSTEVWKRGLD